MKIVLITLLVLSSPVLKTPVRPKPVTNHCAAHSEMYAPACPRLKKGYCKGDFQLCDMG
jgi:hypothetical protein